MGKLGWRIERLKQDTLLGNQIHKDPIPPPLTNRNGLDPSLSNAWRGELPLAFLGVYTVLPGVATIVLIMALLSHKEYDRRFGYCEPVGFRAYL